MGDQLCSTVVAETLDWVELLLLHVYLRNAGHAAQQHAKLSLDTHSCTAMHGPCWRAPYMPAYEACLSLGLSVSYSGSKQRHWPSEPHISGSMALVLCSASGARDGLVVHFQRGC